MPNLFRHHRIFSKHPIDLFIVFKAQFQFRFFVSDEVQHYPIISSHFQDHSPLDDIRFPTISV
jgi:hypothetical protein